MRPCGAGLQVLHLFQSVSLQEYIIFVVGSKFEEPSPTLFLVAPLFQPGSILTDSTEEARGDDTLAFLFFIDDMPFIHSSPKRIVVKYLLLSNNNSTRIG